MPLYRINIPVDAVQYEAQKQGDGFHVEIQVDESEPSQDSWDDTDGQVYSASSQSDESDWYYLKNGNWEPFPSTGVPWKAIGESYTVRWRTEESIGLGNKNYNLRMRTYNGVSYGDPVDLSASFVIDLLSKGYRSSWAGINFWNSSTLRRM